MEYTLVVELYERNEVAVWVLIRDEDKNLEAALPFNTAGDAAACVAGGTLGYIRNCREVFLDNLADPRYKFPNEDMDMEYEGHEGHFPALTWLPLH